MQQKRQDFNTGDWVQVLGTDVPAIEFDNEGEEVAQVNFDGASNPIQFELVERLMGGYWLVRTEEGRYFKIGNRVLSIPGNFKELTYESESSDEDMLDEGMGDFFESLKGNLQKGVITVAAVLGMLSANAQEPEKSGKILDTIGQFGDPKLLKGVQDATGIEWDAATANRLFKFEPDAKKVESQPRKLENLDLGNYKHIAKVTNVNHEQNGGVKYNVDISDRRYLESNIFNKIKEYNSNLKDAHIEFSIKGVPLPTKTITL